MTLRLYNALTRRKEEFRPVDPKNVRMYVCGPTVYQRIHIGNARPLIVFDVLFSLLRHLYGENHVTYVRNVTDIDDKIIDQAAKNGEPIEALTERTYQAFRDDVRALGCLPPTQEPRATQHVPGMVRLIERLIASGHAYSAEGHVLFHVPSMPAYGRLSGRNREDQIAGARIDVAPYKRDPADFVLWKPSTPDRPGWDSPWGRGRPGWHIECSAMSEAFLAPLPFDIHGGGLDLIFPHHENEIAQSCCARQVDRMANYWLHNGFVDMSGEKMSKSVGNVLRMDEALNIVPGEAIRWWMLGTHYRSPIDCSAESLRDAKRAMDRFYLALDTHRAVPATDPAGSITAAMGDDLNTAEALAGLHGLLKDVNNGIRGAAARLVGSARLLGLLNRDVDLALGRTVRPEPARLRHEAPDPAIVSLVSPEWIEERRAARDAARRAKDFSEADRIRSELLTHGIIVEDTATGTKWRRA